MSFWRFGNNNHDDDSDHIDPIIPDFDDDDEDDDDGQTLSVDDAALIWLSNLPQTADLSGASDSETNSLSAVRRSPLIYYQR